MKKKEDKRFEVIFEETGAITSGSRILRDKETGVLYLFHFSGYAGGLTVMLDAEGKPLTAGPAG